MNPSVPMPVLVVRAGGSMTNSSPRELAAGMATVMATVSIRSATNPNPAQTRKNIGISEGTGVVLDMISSEASDAIANAARNVPGVGTKPKSEEVGKRPTSGS